MTEKAFQEYDPAYFNYCYGCGPLNQHGLHLQSYWDGDETVCKFQPKPYHTAFPGYVYGGLLASLIDCHSMGTAVAAAYRADGRDMGTPPPLRFVTASLRVDFLRPTRLGDYPLELRSCIQEIKGRHVVVATEVAVHGEVCVRGEVVAVRMPEQWIG